MDIIYGSDRKLSELGDRDFADFLDHDLFRPTHGPASQNCYLDFPLDDGSWLNPFLDPVLDNSLSDEPQLVKSEHSYSLNKGLDDPVDLTFENKMEIDRDAELLDAINPDLACLSDSHFIDNIAGCDDHALSTEIATSSLETAQEQLTRACQSLLRIPDKTLTFPIEIKPEPLDLSDPDSDPISTGLYETADLPPTPPLSSPSSSDTEGSQGISMSSPPSPSQKHLYQQEVPVTTRQSQNPWTSAISQPSCLYTSHIPTSGILILTEEEKRTLIAEGYPLPTKLPLTKQEEKNLKKIRRKIKNKISAQESRRKKKEYLESLEKKVESMSQENTGLKKKIDILENNNRCLATELQKLQSMANKMVRVSSSGPVQVGTCLMVN